MTENTLKLEVGKRYVRRDGGLTDPLVHNTGAYREGFPYRNPKDEASYTLDGRFLFNPEDLSSLDLVAEYVEQTPATPDPEQTAPAPQKTLRDEFAMAALIGMGMWAPGHDGSDLLAKASWAYQQAEAMLHVRGRQV